MAGEFTPAHLFLPRGDLIAIDLYSGVSGSGKSLLATYRAIDALLEHTNATSNSPMDMSYLKKRKRGKSFYIPAGKVTIKFLLASVKWNHVYEGHKVKRAQAVVITGEAEIKFNSRTFFSSGRVEWVLSFANHRYFNYDSWLAARSDRMIDRQIQGLIQTEFKCRAVTGFGIEGKLVSSLFGDLFCAVPYDHADRIELLLPQLYRLHKRKAEVYNTTHMFGGMTTAGKLEGGKRNAVSVKRQTAFD